MRQLFKLTMATGAGFGLLALGTLSPRAVPMVQASEAIALSMPMAVGTTCAWCSCCDVDCNDMKADPHEDGISAEQGCNPAMCTMPAECEPDEPEDPCDPEGENCGPGNDQEEDFAAAEFAPEDVARVWNAAARGQLGEVRALMQTFPENVLWNAERRSVQIKKCGTYVANIPLAVEDAGLLLAEE